jgi:hypothetical protein
VLNEWGLNVTKALSSTDCQHTHLEACILCKRKTALHGFNRVATVGVTCNILIHALWGGGGVAGVS